MTQTPYERHLERAHTLLSRRVHSGAAGLGTEIVGGTPEALGEAVSDEVRKWAKLVKDRNLKFE